MAALIDPQGNNDNLESLLLVNENGMLSGVSRPATSIARIIDRLSDGAYRIYLEKRPRPDDWTLIIEVSSEVSRIEISRWG